MKTVIAAFAALTALACMPARAQVVVDHHPGLDAAVGREIDEIDRLKQRVIDYEKRPETPGIDLRIGQIEQRLHDDAVHMAALRHAQRAADASDRAHTPGLGPQAAHQSSRK